MSITALFVLAKNMKEPRCFSVGAWSINCGTSLPWNTTQQ